MGQLQGLVLMGLGVMVVAGGCAGGAQGAVRAQASVQLDLPQIGNPKYDRFFGEVVALQKEVSAMRAVIDGAPAVLAASLKEPGSAGAAPAVLDLTTALDRTSAKLFGKVKVVVAVGPAGVVVELRPVRKVELSDQDRRVIEAYRKVMLDLAQLPLRLRPVGERTASIVKQAIGLASSARQDFMGIGLIRTLPSVVRGIMRVKDAVARIKEDMPVILQRTGTTYVAMKRSMGLPPTVDFQLELPGVGAALASAVPLPGAAGALTAAVPGAAVASGDGVAAVAQLAGGKGKLSGKAGLGRLVGGKGAAKAVAKVAGAKALKGGKGGGLGLAGARATSRLR